MKMFYDIVEKVCSSFLNLSARLSSTAEESVTKQEKRQSVSWRHIHILLVIEFTTQSDRSIIHFKLLVWWKAFIRVMRLQW